MSAKKRTILVTLLCAIPVIPIVLGLVINHYDSIPASVIFPVVIVEVAALAVVEIYLRRMKRRRAPTHIPRED